MSSLDDLFAQLEALARRQFPDDQLGQIHMLNEMLKTRIREMEYRAERIGCLHMRGVPDVAWCGSGAVDEKRGIGASDSFAPSKISDGCGATYVTAVIGANRYWKRLEKVEEIDALANASTWGLNQQVDFFNGVDSALGKYFGQASSYPQINNADGE